MRVLFVYPNIHGFHKDGYHFGLGSILSSTIQNGHECKFVAVNSEEDFNNVIMTVKEFSPRVVGFSSVSSQYGSVKKMATMIKEQFPKVLIVCGGVHPTIYPEALLESHNIDGFFLGESELPFVEFLQRVEGGDSYHETDNFAYVNNGILIKNKLQPRMLDLDKLPPPDKTVYPYSDIMKRRGLAEFLFNRGCPFLCTYCSNEAIAKTYGKTRNTTRYKSPELCIQEIEDVLNQHSFDYISIVDDVFGMNRKWLRDFLSLYKKRIGVKFTCLLRVEIAKEDLIAELKEHCCDRIFFGIESGNEYIRTKLMNRKMTNEEIIQVFDLCRKYELRTLAVNIIGVPGETESMVWETINLNRRIKPTTSGVNIFYPYKGTVLGNYCFDNNLVDIKQFEDFSNERRETVLKFSEEHKKKLSYFYKNWDILVYPFDVKIRAVRLLDKIGLLQHARKIKRSLTRIIKSRDERRRKSTGLIG